MMSLIPKICNRRVFGKSETRDGDPSCRLRYLTPNISLVSTTHIHENCLPSSVTMASDEKHPSLSPTTPTSPYVSGSMDIGHPKDCPYCTFFFLGPSWVCTGVWHFIHSPSRPFHTAPSFIWNRLLGRWCRLPKLLNTLYWRTSFFKWVSHYLEKVWSCLLLNTPIARSIPTAARSKR